jgi:hypothetical protein
MQRFWKVSTDSTENTSMSEDEGISLNNAEWETMAVKFLRIAVIALLLAVATLVSVAVYLYMRNEERQSFVAQFEDSSFKVIESFHAVVEDSLGAVGAMATTITSFAVSQT